MFTWAKEVVGKQVVLRLGGLFRGYQDGCSQTQTFELANWQAAVARCQEVPSADRVHEVQHGPSNACRVPHVRPLHGAPSRRDREIIGGGGGVSRGGDPGLAWWDAVGMLARRRRGECLKSG